MTCEEKKIRHVISNDPPSLKIGTLGHTENNFTDLTVIAVIERTHYRNLRGGFGEC